MGHNRAIVAAERIAYFHPEHGLVRVKTGFSWPAFFLGSLWGFAKHAWRATLIMMGVEVLLWFGNGFAGAYRNPLMLLACLAAQVAWAVTRGRRANGWWRARLLAQGYRAMGAKLAA